MTVERVQCVECDNLILPQTAKANGGLCAPCAKLPTEVREEMRQFARSLETGEAFRPTAEERASARWSMEVFADAAHWRIERPGESESSDPASGDGPAKARTATAAASGAGATLPRCGAETEAAEAVARAAGESGGALYLLVPGGPRLNLAFNERFGVCDYQHEAVDEYRYAYAPASAGRQVAEDEHLVQSCPCCGVGMLWYPSRFHLPRELAFDIVTAVVSGRSMALAEVQWLTYGDISRTSRGRG